MKNIIVSAFAFAVLAGAAHAGGHAQNGNAQGMAATIQGLGSGKEPARSYTGGWGNIAGPAAAMGKGQNNVGPKAED